MKLSPLATFRKTSNALYTFTGDKEKLLVKCYRGCSAYDHIQQEQFALTYWRQAGYSVPEIRDLIVPPLEQPYLVMTYIDGLSLREYLSSERIALDQKLLAVEKFFADMSTRHKRAIKNDDRHLLHYDPSSGNVILADNKFYYIDFEAPPQRHGVLDAASAELATVCRWIVRDLGIDSLKDVLRVMVSAYADQQVLLRRTVNRTTGRPFQFYHRWQDRKRKLAQPQNVTKYDIADALRKIVC